jgi:hypothetical protein
MPTTKKYVIVVTWKQSGNVEIFGDLADYLYACPTIQAKEQTIWKHLREKGKFEDKTRIIKRNKIKRKPELRKSNGANTTK